MPAYRFIPRLRMTPDNGLPETVNLTTGWNGVPANVLTSAVPTYRTAQASETALDDTLIVTRKGTHAEIKLSFDIATMSNFETLNKVINRFLSPEWKMELALDTDGNLYREVELVEVPSPRGFKGKTTGGATFELSVKTKQTFNLLYPIGSGSGW